MKMNIFGGIRYALRQFAQAPVFTAAAVLTLALGIGGTTAIFSLIHAVMLRSLPVANPASLYRIGEGNDCCDESGPQDQWGLFSFPLYERIRQNLPEFEQTTAFEAARDRFGVRGQDEHAARPLNSEFVSGTYFSTLGIRPYAGRLLSDIDDQTSAAPVAVMSYHAWKQTYGGDPSVLGSTYYIAGHPFTLIGIAPPGFFGETLRSDPPELWIPLQQEPLIDGKSALLHQSPLAWLRVIGRLRPGASIAGVAPRLTAILHQWMLNDSGYPADWMAQVKKLLPTQTIRIIPAGAGVTEMKESYGHSLIILFFVCGAVLLIACANVANLLLARASARRAQTAVRIAVGASRRQIVWQALVESVLLGFLGGATGLAVAVGASKLLLLLAFHEAKFVPFGGELSLPVLGFAFAISLLTGMIFGTAPAWLATHTHPIDALRGASRITRDSGSWARKTLLIVQATVSVVLVAAAVMLGRSLGNLEHQNFGFETANRVVVRMNTPSASYSPDHLNALYRQMETRLKQISGVQQVGLGLYAPLTNNWSEVIMAEGHRPATVNENATSSWDRVSGSYLSVMGQRVLRGRGFTEADNENTAPVAVVNEAFVKRFFPNEDPLDKHFGMDEAAYAGTFRIIGVIPDAKYTEPRDPAHPMFFVPLAQYIHYPDPLMQNLELRTHFIQSIVLVTHTKAGALEPLLTKALADIDPNLTITSVRSLDDQVTLEFDQERAVSSLAGLFGVIALLLAAVGLYGVTAYSVTQRTAEIGVRMALGADRTKVIQLVLHGAFHRVGIGLLLGVPLAIAAGRMMASQLWGVRSWDPLALSIASIALGICALIAAMIPALRAASIDPLEALRAE